MLGRPSCIQVCPWQVSGVRLQPGGAIRQEYVKATALVCCRVPQCVAHLTMIYPRKGPKAGRQCCLHQFQDRTHVRAEEDDQASVYAPAGCMLLACTCTLPAAVPTLPNLPASVGLQANSVVHDARCAHLLSVVLVDVLSCCIEGEVRWCASYI